MGIFGKIGAGLSQIGKYYTSPEGAQSALSILQDYGTGDSANYRALQAQRQKLAQAQQEQQALAALMGQMKPQDTQTPTINNMIDMNNQRMGGFDNGAQFQSARQDVGKAGLDFSNPETLKAFAQYASMPGANAQLPLAISQMMQPEKPEFKTYSADDDIYQVGPDGTPTLFRPGTPKMRDPGESMRWQIGPDGKPTGNLEPIPGGKWDPKQVGIHAQAGWRPRVGRASKPVDANSVKWD